MSVELTLIKRYNLLMQTNLINVDIESMSQIQIKTYMKNLNKLFITDSTDIFAGFFQ